MPTEAAETVTAPTSPGPLQLIADPQRWRLLQELTRSDRRVGELCALLDRPQNLVSYHVAQLRRAGLVTGRRSSADGRDTYYRIDVQHCGEVFAQAGAALHPAIRLHSPTPSLTPRRGRRATTVLFLCTGNSARSQIAQALLEHRSAGTISARSAGSHPKRLHPNAVRALAERGIDIGGRGTTHIDQLARTRFDHVITLCDKVREVCPEFPGQPTTSHWSIADPAAPAGDDEATYPRFVSVTDEIDGRVGLLIAQIAATSHSTQPSPSSGSRREKRP